ncbi:hypothetical protein SKAU_G00037440 [Synaphobranchus kaupii]|uniref:Uncharacterized protein n=1 Tax=Synaphobranchus kaupii TaxID=118154 RepID=A0A9Q1GET7_SYNKA|nr:hypothetical protein SKAU_G00037440 [Synaphobranchus kaupii]
MRVISQPQLYFKIPQEDAIFTGSGDGGFYSNAPQNNSEVSLALVGLSGEAVGSGDGGFQRAAESNSSSPQSSNRIAEEHAALAKPKMRLKTVEMCRILWQLVINRRKTPMPFPLSKTPLLMKASWVMIYSVLEV